MSEERRDARREPGEPCDRPVGPVPGDAGDPGGTTSGAAPADPWALPPDRKSPADRLPPSAPDRQRPAHTGPAADPFATPSPARVTAHPPVPVAYAPLPAHGTPHSGPVTRPVPPPPPGPEGPGVLSVPYPFPGAPPAPVHHSVPGPGWRAFPPPPNNSFGLTAQILGIVSLGVWLWPVTLVTGVLALVYGGLARSRVAKGLSTNPGQARAGMICGGVGLLLAVGLTVAIVLVEGR
ncbi:hypothetical protein ACFWIA_09440 [Streptomyces sp. NPDC127068]|uniref:hypothetical protein n=1 Tax=Streptomyces sp. NPDC127068 TaxID=3347127 RepID=UPI0036569E19